MRDKDCGDCAWGLFYHDIETNRPGVCRRVAFGEIDPSGNDHGLLGEIIPDDPACPAFVSKNQPVVEDEHIGWFDGNCMCSCCDPNGCASKEQSGCVKTYIRMGDK